MAISVTSAFRVADNTVRVTFSEAFTQDAALFDRSNFAFLTRFGTDIPIYAKSIVAFGASTADVTLQDSMLEGGNYQVTVRGVSALSDGIPIETGPGPNLTNFTGEGDSLRCFEIRKRVPPWLDTRYGSTLHALLCGTGAVHDTLAGAGEGAAVKEAAKSLLLRTATGTGLGVIGANFGVSRPEFVVNDDALFRKLIPIFAAKRKAVISIFYDALEAVFGPAADAGWRIFEIEDNEVTIELPADLFFGLAPGTLNSATYLHDADAGTSTSTGVNFLADTSKSWAVNQWQNAKLLDALAVTRTITSNTATTLTVSGTPAGGAYSIFFTASDTYPGDYFLADETVAGSTIDDNIIVLFQQTIIDDIVNALKASGIVIQVVVTA